MANPLFGNQKTSQMPDIKQLYGQFQKNPTEFLLKSRFNIPDGMSNPQGIIQHLLNSGQLSQQTLTQAQTIYHQMIGK